MTEKEKFELIVKIAKRAEEMDLVMFDRISLIMDLECADEEFDLRLEELLAADNFNFSHDVAGIQNNLNRQKRKMGNTFVPRYAEI